MSEARLRWGLEPRRIAALAIGALALVELVAAARAYRPQLSPHAWAAARAALADVPASEPIRVLPAWLDPSARAHLPGVAAPAAIGLPDLHGAPRVHVLRWGAAARDDAWPAALAGDVEGLAEPLLEAQAAAGPFAWHTYALPGAGAPLFDLLAAPARAITVRDAWSGCPAQGEGASARWSCPAGTRVTRKLAEIDYVPRRCALIEGIDDDVVTLRARDVRLGSRLRGHVGVHDFNRRLRSDAPVVVVLRLDGTPLLRAVVSDAEGWRAFEASVPADRRGGVGTVELELTLPAPGTWPDGAYHHAPAHAPCVELRSLP